MSLGLVDEHGRAPVEVSVTAEHIRKGDRCSCTACPIALAVDDILMDGFRAIVGKTGCHIEHKESGPFPHSKNDLPAKAVAFIESFDACRTGADVKPFTFRFMIDPLLLTKEEQCLRSR